MALIGGVAASWPLAARAQQTPIPVVGFLGSESADKWADRVHAFRQGLAESGYVEGRNVTIDYRWAEAQYDRLPALVTELVRLPAAVIAVGGVPEVRAAKAATSTTPIVFQIGVDPVAAGLVGSLSHPGGNLTGASNLSIALGQKRLELLHEAVPSARIVALLVDPTNGSVSEIESRSTQVAAQQLGLELHVLHATSERDFDAVFAALDKLKAAGLVIGNTGIFNARAAQLGALSLRHAIPAIFQSRGFAASGGLMSYGTSIPSGFRIIGVYAGRILRGEHPADLPVQESTEVELIINLKTAKALGITVPLPLLGRADEVIE